jgi:2-amino-4-hydroxy-6-hydroxymethyldihydropteridine diphosphokinase
MVEVVLSLGSNAGDRAECMERMEREVGLILDPPLVKSRLMETKPIGMPGEGRWFYNRLIRARCRLACRELLRQCHAIEVKLGRPANHLPLSPRTADIDILLYGDIQIKERDLTIPHPCIQVRRFCVLGLREIAPDWRVPGFRKRVDELVDEWESAVRDQQVRYADWSGNGIG